MIERGLDPGHQQLGRPRRHHAVVAPLEQRNAQLPLDPCQGLRYRGLGQVDGIGRRTDRAQPCYPGHGLQVPKIEIPDFHAAILSQI
jgi:hypothetical protein